MNDKFATNYIIILITSALIENLLAIRCERIICMVFLVYIAQVFINFNAFNYIFSFSVCILISPMVKRQLTLINIPYNLVFVLSLMKRDQAKKNAAVILN